MRLHDLLLSTQLSEYNGLVQEESDSAKDAAMQQMEESIAICNTFLAEES